MIAPPVALTVAGSDSGGGAGIQADLKTFAALGVHGVCAISALTAQSTTEVRGIMDVPADFVTLQLQTLADDFTLSAAKTGMLAREDVIRAVGAFFGQHSMPLVVDPVLVAASGAQLVSSACLSAIVGSLFPLATVVTPNLDEVEVLVGARPEDEDGMIEAGRALVGKGARAALVKGGHLVGDPVDVLIVPQNEPMIFRGPRIATTAGHGTGCTYAAAIAAHLALGETLPGAVALAHTFVREALRAAPEGLGRGPAPLLHVRAPRG